MHHRRNWFFLDFLKLASVLLVHMNAWANLYYGVYCGPPWVKRYEWQTVFDAVVFLSCWFMSFSLAVWHLSRKSALWI